jgi:LysM domain
MRFHDVPHTTITVLLRLKVPMHLMQRIARHSKIRLTVATYGHLEVDDLCDAMELLGDAAGVAPDGLEAPKRTRIHSRGVQLGSKRFQRAEKEDPGRWRFLRSRALVLRAQGDEAPGRSQAEFAGRSSLSSGPTTLHLPAADRIRRPATRGARMSLLTNYDDVLQTAKKVGVNLTETKEENGKVVLRGNTEFAFDRDRLWDQIKTHGNWQNEIIVMLDVKQTALYGIWQVQGGDTLSKIAKTVYGDPKAYPKIFDINKDQLQDPDQIKVGQKLKLPNRDASGHVA